MFTLIWIVGITNAFNLLDNMDGLCAGVAMVACMSMVFLYNGINPSACLLALIVAGACLGFLIYNFNPASIFMGDCGSLVIGFAIAVLSLQYGKNGHFKSAFRVCRSPADPYGAHFGHHVGYYHPFVKRPKSIYRWGAITPPTDWC